MSELRLNAYRIMWLFVFFDLPTNTKAERRHAAQFRKALEKDGFTMMQYSVYVRHCASKENMAVHLNRVRKSMPPSGYTSILSVTDKQYDAIYPPVLSFGRHMLQNESVWLSLLGTHAVALMINAVARRRLVMTYIAAFVLMLTVQFLMVRILGTWNDRGASPYDLITVKKWSNVLLTIVSWTGSYFILRRKQINW